MQRGLSIALTVCMAALSLGADAPHKQPASAAELSLAIVFHPGKTPPSAIYFAAANTLVSIDQRGKILLWDAGSGQTLAALKDPTTRQTVSASALSADGKRLLVSYGSGQIDAFDLDQRRLFKTLEFPVLGAMAFSLDGSQVVGVSGADGSIKIVDVSSGKSLLSASSPGCSRFFSVAWSPDGRRIVGMWDRAKGLVWLDAVTLNETRLSVPDLSSTALSFSPDGGVVYTAIQQPDSRSVLALDAATGKKVWAAPMWQGIKHFSLSRDGKRMALLAGDNPAITVRDTATGRNVFTSHRTERTAGQLIDVAISPDGSNVAAMAVLPKGDEGSERYAVEIYSAPLPKKIDE